MSRVKKSSSGLEKQNAVSWLQVKTSGTGGMTDKTSGTGGMTDIEYPPTGRSDKALSSLEIRVLFFKYPKEKTRISFLFSLISVIKSHMDLKNKTAKVHECTSFGVPL